MSYLVKNNAYGRLAASVMTVDTSLVLDAGQGERFPVIVSPDFSFATLENVEGNREIVRVTGRSSGSDALTVVRAQEGTTARSWKVGDVVECRLVARLVEQAMAHPEQTVNAHGAKAISAEAVGGLPAGTVASQLAALLTKIESLGSGGGSLVGGSGTLTFTPVQQGGGAGQGNSKVHIGWGGGALRLQVDSTDYGKKWPIDCLNADTLGGHPASQFMLKGDASNSLGFTPVRQGGGKNQNIHSTLYMGWSTSANGLFLQIDTTDFGRKWPIDCSNADTVGGLTAGQLGSKSKLNWKLVHTTNHGSDVSVRVNCYDNWGQGLYYTVGGSTHGVVLNISSDAKDIVTFISNGSVRIYKLYRGGNDELF